MYTKAQQQKVLQKSCQKNWQLLKLINKQISINAQI